MVPVQFDLDLAGNSSVRCQSLCFQESDMAGCNEVLGGGGIHHVAIRVKDFDASVKFYCDELGFKELLSWGEGDKRAAMLDTGDGCCFEIFAGGTGHGSDGAFLHLALNCKDIDGVIERVRTAGMEIRTEPKDVEIPSDPPTSVRLAFFKGPDEEVVELFCKRS